MAPDAQETWDNLDKYMSAIVNQASEFVEDFTKGGMLGISMDAFEDIENSNITAGQAYVLGLWDMFGLIDHDSDLPNDVASKAQVMLTGTFIAQKNQAGAVAP